MDKTRRDENRTLAKAGASPLVKSKWLWLRSPEKLTDKQRALFAALQAHDLETSKVWSFKEAFRDFFCAGSVTEGEAFFGNWYEQALVLGNRHLTKVAQMLQDHLPGLLAGASGLECISKRQAKNPAPVSRQWRHNVTEPAGRE